MYCIDYCAVQQNIPHNPVVVLVVLPFFHMKYQHNLPTMKGFQCRKEQASLLLVCVVVL